VYGNARRKVDVFSKEYITAVLPLAATPVPNYSSDG
jgi:hypothetical protein